MPLPVSKLRCDTHSQEYKLIPHCAESLRHNNIYTIVFMNGNGT